ncbi:MAG: hypothetical protein ABID09_02550 [Candidatus Omnitrophota bacterium]
MKRIILSILVVTFFFSVNVICLETKILEVRNKIFEESKSIKPAIADSRDAVVLGNLRDTCLMVSGQLDAYFYMLGIFNTISEDDLTYDSISYLNDWLGRVKSLNRQNLDSLKGIGKGEIKDPKTKTHINNIESYFTELDTILNGEISRIVFLTKNLKGKQEVAQD